MPRDDLDVTVFVGGVRRSQAALEQVLQHISDEEVRQPSLLPGWTRGHVLTHIARNADGAARMLQAAAQGVVGEQYPGGWDRRNGDIDAGSARPVEEIVADISQSAQQLDGAINAMPDDAWNRDVRFLRVGIQPAWRCVFTRWREIEIHWSDLGPDRTPADWPDEFVQAFLGRELSRLGERLQSGTAVELRCPGYDGVYGEGTARITVSGPPYAIYAWLTGRSNQVRDALRGDLPDIGAWG